MKLTPVEIQGQQFKKTFRGYEPMEVDSFMAAVATDMEDVLRENSFLKDELDKANAELLRLRDLEQTLKDTVIAAQKMAESYRETTRKEADLMLDEARSQAEKIRYEAERRLAEVNGEVARRQARLAEMREVVRGLLNGFIEHIDRTLPDGK